MSASLNRAEVPLRHESLAPRDVIARAIYETRPFTMACSSSVMDVMRVDRVLGWDEAPEFYRSECYEIADAVHARLLLSEHAALLGRHQEAA